MPKLRLARFIPLFQLAAAVILFHIGHGEHGAKGLDFPYSPTGRLVCFGISAPALPILCLLFLMPVGWKTKTIVGFDLAELIFLAGVVILWSVVVRAIERHSTILTESKPLAYLISTLMLLLGISLFSLGFFGIQQRDNVLGSIASGSLFITWALLLGVASMFSFSKLAKRKRHQDRS